MDEKILNNIINTIPETIYWMNKEGRIIGCNDKQAKLFGLKNAEELKGKNIFDVGKILGWPQSIPNNIRKNDMQVIESGERQVAEEMVILNNEEHIFLSIKDPWRNDENEIIGIIGIAIDITDKKEMEQLKIENEENKRSIKEILSKLDGMMLVGASIAHEIRTPLATLDINADTLKENLPLLIEAYNSAIAEKLNVPQIDSFILEGLREIPFIMKRETKGANTFINMLLMNINPELEGSLNQIFSMQNCVNEALARYPFKPNQYQYIKWENQRDFRVQGKEKLVVHVLFNLIKNALFYVGNGHIEIILSSGNPYNQLIFIDTGAGIEPDILPHIFDRFFSRTRNGSGVGLAYCKTVMEALGGNITCESMKGSYTKFTLSFPTIS